MTTTATETFTTTTTAVTKVGERIAMAYPTGYSSGHYDNSTAALTVGGVAFTGKFGVSLGDNGATVTPLAGYEIPAGSLVLTVTYATRLSGASSPSWIKRQPKGTLTLHDGDLLTLSRAGATTFFLAVPVPADAVAIRLIYANHTLSTYAITGAAVAPSTTFNDGMVPTGGGTFGHVTWNGGGADLDDLYDLATTIQSGGTVPATTSPDDGTGKRAPKLWFSDWNNFSTLAPASGSIRCVMIRTYGPIQTWVGPTVGASGWTGVAAVNKGWDYWARLGTMDAVTDPTAAIGTTGTATTHPVYAVQFLLKSGVVSLLDGGDSHFAADTTTQAINNFMTQTAIALSAAGIPALPFTSAWGGSKRVASEPTLLNALTASSANVVFLQGWTANDPTGTTADIDKQLARVFRAYQRVLQAGSHPVILTPFCRNAAFLTGGVLTAWQYAYAQLMLAKSAGHNVLDVTTALASSMTTGTYKTGLSTDDIHPNDAGHAVIAALTSAYIQARVV